MEQSKPDDFDTFLGKANERSLRRQEFRALVQRYKDFLQGQGVKLNEEIKFELTMLASAKLMIEAALEDADDPIPILSIKKKMQAHFMLKSRGEAFAQLIDNEFPGESLTDIDIDIIAAQFSAELEIQERIMREYEKTESEMLTAIGHDEITELNDSEMKAMDDLIFVFGSAMRPQDKLEQARSVLIHYGLLESWSVCWVSFWSRAVWQRLGRPPVWHQLCAALWLTRAK